MLLDTFKFFLLPVSSAIISMILGILLLKKHAYVKFYPWVMSITFFLFHFYIYLGLMLYDKFGFWILSFLFKEGFFSTLSVWGIICSISNFCCAFISEIYLKRNKEKEYIIYDKKNNCMYILVSFLPIDIFLLCWLSYYILDYINPIILMFLLLEVVNMVILLKVNKYKDNFKRRLNLPVFYIIISLLLVLILIKYKESVAFCWLLFYWLIYYLYYVMNKVKKSNSLESKSYYSSKKSYTIINFIPLITMIVSCILLSNIF